MAELQAPAGRPVMWIGFTDVAQAVDADGKQWTVTSDERLTVVKAQTWIYAIHAAATELGVSPEYVICTRLNPNEES